MGALKSNIFIISIAIYIIGIKFFELIFSLGQYLVINNELSNTVFYIISGICGLLAVLIMRFLYKKYNDNWLYFLIGGVLIIYLITYFVTRNLGESIGESNFDIDKFVLYENARSYIFIAIHVVLFAFHKYLLNDKNE